MGAHLHLLSTPSDGVDEVVKALQLAHAYPTRTVTVVRLRRHFGPRVLVADIETALAAAVSAGYVADSSGHFKLTDDGHAHARQVTNRFLYVT